MLRNSLINLSPFPFKECSERIIDFYFLVLSTFSEEKFWPPLHSAIMLDRVLPGGDWGLVKQRSKLLNYEIEFSDAFQTKIGSCPVQAAMTAFILQKTGKRAHQIWWAPAESYCVQYKKRNNSKLTLVLYCTWPWSDRNTPNVRIFFFFSVFQFFHAMENDDDNILMLFLYIHIFILL